MSKNCKKIKNTNKFVSHFLFLERKMQIMLKNCKELVSTFDVSSKITQISLNIFYKSEIIITYRIFTLLKKNSKKKLVIGKPIHDTSLLRAISKIRVY